MTSICHECGQPRPVRYFTFRCSECGKHCAVTVKRGHRRLTCSYECYRARCRRLQRAACGRAL